MSNAQGSGRGLWGVLKDAVWEESKASPAVPGEAPQVPMQTPVSAPVANITPNPGALNPMVEKMMTVVMSKTTAYTALVEAIKPLEQYIPDEGARYKAAFAIVGKSRTVEQIIQAIDLQHIVALEGEVQRFSAQVRHKESAEVASRQQIIGELQEKIRASNEEAERLRKQTDARLAELIVITNEAVQQIALNEREIDAENDSIAQSGAQFAAATDAVKGTLQDAKSKVLRYLTA